MNQKIKKLQTERERNSNKIAKLTARNEEIDQEITRLENLDIIGMVRAFGVSPDRLYELLQSKPAAAAEVAQEYSQSYDDGQSDAEPQDYTEEMEGQYDEES